MLPKAMLLLAFIAACKRETPLEGGASSPRPLATGPNTRPEYATQTRIDNNQTRLDNNQTPLGGQSFPPITSPQYAIPDTNRNLQFEELTINGQNPTTVTITNIRSQQVFQRNSQNQAQIFFGVTPPARPARYFRARAVFDGNRQPLSQYLTIDLSQNQNQPLSLTMTGGGWYRIEVLYLDQNGRISELGYSNPFGVGEVFLVAGQSNSTNCGSTRINVSTNYVVSTDGETWQTGNDPQIGTNDFSICQNGSSWPAAGDDLVVALQVPVAFASTGYSGTSSSEWVPNAGRGLYEFSMQRAFQLESAYPRNSGQHGFRAILWHQGENDVRDETPQQIYTDRMSQIIRQSQQDLGWQVPWLVAQAAWCRQITEYNKPQIEAQILAAQAALPRLLPTVFAGPNTDLLTEAFRGTNCHFNQQGAVASGKAWARSVLDFLQRNGGNFR